MWAHAFNKFTQVAHSVMNCGRCCCFALRHTKAIKEEGGTEEGVKELVRKRIDESPDLKHYKKRGKGLDVLVMKIIEVTISG